MQLEGLLKTFGYADSPNLLKAGQRELETSPALGHVFRLATAKLGLQGVYALRPPSSPSNEPIIPIVYVCSADSEDRADLTHRLIWNQDVVPFLLVQTPDCLKSTPAFIMASVVEVRRMGFYRPYTQRVKSASSPTASVPMPLMMERSGGPGGRMFAPMPVLIGAYWITLNGLTNGFSRMA